MNSQTKSQFKKVFFHKKESIIPRANYLKLEQAYRRGQRVVHAFFENRDDLEFYRTAINYVYRDYMLKEYLQEGKQNVIDGYQEVNWDKYHKSHILFFADKDYDDIIQSFRITSPNFFYTKWYSIENYLVTEESLLVVLRNFFTNMTEVVEQAILILFRAASKEFHSHLKSITRFILIFRRLKKELDLDKIVMQDFLSILKMSVVSRRLVAEKEYNLITRDAVISPLQKSLIRKDSIKDILVLKCKAEKELINFSNIMQSDRMLKSITEPKVFARGKYELWFFTELINTVEHVIDDIYSQHRIDIGQNPKPSRKIQVTNLNAFHLIASKLSFPDEVVSFLNLNFSQIP